MNNGIKSGRLYLFSGAKGSHDILVLFLFWNIFNPLPLRKLCSLDQFVFWVPKMTLQSGVTSNKTYLFTLLSITELHTLTPQNTVDQLIGWVLPQGCVSLEVKVESLSLLLHVCNWLSPRAGSTGVHRQAPTSAAAAASRTACKTGDATQLASDNPSGRVQSREVVWSRCGVGSCRGGTQLRGSAASEHGPRQGLGHQWCSVHRTKGHRL